MLNYLVYYDERSQKLNFYENFNHSFLTDADAVNVSMLFSLLPKIIKRHLMCSTKSKMVGQLERLVLAVKIWRSTFTELPLTMLVTW
jgi:hypothetical protein